MPDFWMDVDIALAEVPVNILPLIDNGDFKSIENTVAYDAAGMALIWNFITTAGAYTSTVVTPTTGGIHDWIDHGTTGLYALEIPASGGTINNDTEGFGFFTGVATGVLPWRGPTIGFRAAALNNALIDGGDVLDVSVTELGGVAQSATDLKDFADAGYDPGTNKVQGVVLVDTTTANSDMVTEPPTVAQIQAEMEENGASLLDTIRDELANATDGLSALKTLLDNIPTVAEFNARTLVAADYFLFGTDTVTVGTNSDKTGYRLSATGVDDVLDEAGAGALVGEPGSLRELIYFVIQVAKNKLEYIKATDKMSLYEDNSADKKWEHSMTDDATEATRGKGV